MKFRASLAIRLTAALIGLVFLTTASVIAGIYLVGVRLPMTQIRAEVVAEANQLSSIYVRGGVESLKAALVARRQVPSPNKPFDAILERDGTLITGNFPSWPTRWSGDWHRIEADLYRDGDEDDHDALSRDLLLPDGRRLIVGRDVEVLSDRQELMGEVVLWGSISVLLFGVLGAVLISRITGQRLEAVSTTARSVMQGDLSVRVPVQGSGDEFDRLGITLNAMLDRNVELMASIARVSDNIAHELRTPLARLRAALGEACDGAAIEPKRAETARREAERLRQIFDALLRIARLDTGRHRIEHQAVHLDELVSDAVEFYAPEAVSKGQSLTGAVVPCTVLGDRDLLFQAITNLLDNALKFAPQGGEVQVNLAAEGEGLTLAVRDNGPGVAEQHRARLTERFYRAPGTEAKAGAGLGLALADAILQAHGGTLQFSGSPGNFSAIIRLPSLKW